MTRDEIDALKRAWRKDPCWDIETTEGFEQHTEELLAFRKECEARWKDVYQDELKEFAETLGLGENLKLAEYIRRLENRIDRLEEGG